MTSHSVKQSITTTSLLTNDFAANSVFIRTVTLDSLMGKITTRLHSYNIQPRKNGFTRRNLFQTLPASVSRMRVEQMKRETDWITSKTDRLQTSILKQFEHFIPDRANGLTQAGLSRINQSIEAFVYCVFGAQVNVRSSIFGDGGRAKEAQNEFLVLMEDAIRMPGLAKSEDLCKIRSNSGDKKKNLWCGC